MSLFFDNFREFARWKVRNTAIERRDLIRNPVPLMPEFQRSVRLLGRRPTTQQFIETIIKKYGTHILISATLGGKRRPAKSFSPSHAWLTVFFFQTPRLSKMTFFSIKVEILFKHSRSFAPVYSSLFVRKTNFLQTWNSYSS